MTLSLSRSECDLSFLPISSSAGLLPVVVCGGTCTGKENEQAYLQCYQLSSS